MQRYLEILPLLVRLRVKSEMEYRGAYLLDRLAQIVAYGSAFATVWLIVNRFAMLGGWRWPELALLLSAQLVAYASGAALSFTQFRDLEEQVRLGTFDALLVRPINPWLYLTFSGLNIGYLGHVILAVALMAWALVVADVDWTAWRVLYFIAALVSASLVVAAVMTMIGVSALVLVQSSYLYSIFFGFWELTRYPISIYPAALQWALVTVVPLGFMNYVPVAVFLGKDVALLGPWGMALSLLAGPAAVSAAIWHWRWCLARYQGGGG